MAHIRPQDVFVLVICLIVHLGYRYCRRSAIPFPPEPRRWPIIGHALSIPLTFMPRTYKDMGAELSERNFERQKEPADRMQEPRSFTLKRLGGT